MAQLCRRQDELQKLNTRVIIISFGTLPSVQQWLKESCSSFTVLLDRERVVYNAFGLERSYWRSRNIKTRWLYFKAWLSGKKAHDTHGDDTSQLGGDFIVDKNGVLRFVYPCYDPTDRPPIKDLFEILKALS